MDTISTTASIHDTLVYSKLAFYTGMISSSFIEYYPNLRVPEPALL